MLLMVEPYITYGFVCLPPVPHEWRLNVLAPAESPTSRPSASSSTSADTARSTSSASPCPPTPSSRALSDSTESSRSRISSTRSRPLDLTSSRSPSAFLPRLRDGIELMEKRAASSGLSSSPTLSAAPGRASSAPSSRAASSESESTLSTALFARRTKWVVFGWEGGRAKGTGWRGGRGEREGVGMQLCSTSRIRWLLLGSAFLRVPCLDVWTPEKRFFSCAGWPGQTCRSLTRSVASWKASVVQRRDASRSCEAGPCEREGLGRRCQFPFFLQPRSNAGTSWSFPGTVFADTASFVCGARGDGKVRAGTRDNIVQLAKGNGCAGREEGRGEERGAGQRGCVFLCWA